MPFFKYTPKFKVKLKSSLNNNHPKRQQLGDPTNVYVPEKN